MKLTKKAHAKLNLFLEVTGKRGDGYHELFSLAVFLDLADEITIEPADAITVTQSNGDAGIAENIILKTANLLSKRYKIKSGAKITFVKNIPIGGGLGGGSADAAATLVLLNNLWNLNLKPDEMYQLALELGADVPVCLYSILENTNAAMFQSIGEKIAATPKIPEMFFTLVNPAVELATKKVFENFKYEGLGYEPLPEKGDFIKNIVMRTNDLEPAAIALVPEIDTALSELEATKNCTLARMTGSGATSFGIYKSRRDAHNAAVALIKKYPNWQIGAVNLKKISAYGKWEKLKRPLLKKQVRAMKKLHVKTLMAQNFSLSTILHLLILFLLGSFFLYREYAPKPETITVSIGTEKPPAPEYKPVEENDLEPAEGDVSNDDVIIKAEEPPLQPAPPPVVEKPAEKPKPAKKAAVKAPTKKPGKPPGILGAKNGNSKKPYHPPIRDYLQLLQYTVQQRSIVPGNDPTLKGRAILHLAFNRQGYVLAYVLKQSTGSDILDKAAEKTAKNLMNNPFPPAPWDFDTGEDVLEYDFVISYPRH